MDIEKATLADVWPLAWSCSLAFSNESRRPLLKARAVLGYSRHLLYLLTAALDGTLWHADRRFAISIEPERKGMSPSLWVAVGVVAFALCAGASPLLLIPGNREEAGRLISVLLIILSVVAGVFIIGIVAIIRSRPIRHFKAYSAVAQWKRELKPSSPYTIAYLAMHPDEERGAGFRFARAAMIAVVPEGAGLCTIARSTRHERAYRAYGFRHLPFKGKPTAGMAGTMPAKTGGRSG